MPVNPEAGLSLKEMAIYCSRQMGREVVVEQVRHLTEELCADGLLYSTIDECHFQRT